MDLYTHVLISQKQESMQKLETVLDSVFDNSDNLTEERFEKEQQDKEKIINFNNVG